MEEKVDHPKATISKISDGIIIVTYKSGTMIDLSDAKEIDAIQVQLAEGKKMNVLIDVFEIENKVSEEARKFFTNKAKMISFTKKVATLQRDQQKNLKGNFFSGILRPLYETQSFDNRELAMNWLRD